MNRTRAIVLRNPELPAVLDPCLAGSYRLKLWREASEMMAEWYRERGITSWKYEHVGFTPTTIQDEEPTREVA